MTDTTPSLTRRKFLTFAAAGAGALALAACGGTAAPAAPASSVAPSSGSSAAFAAVSGSASAKPSAASPAGKAGGTAISAMDSDPDTLNLATTTGYPSGDVGAKIFEGLIWLDANYNAQPAL